MDHANAHRAFLFVIVLLLAACLCSCVRGGLRSLGDCGWLVHGMTWIDENGNGKWDPGEEPAPGIRVFVRDEAEPERFWHAGTSNEAGEARIMVGVGCPHNPVVDAVAPDGYRPTTPTRIFAWITGDENTYQFGFQRPDASLPHPFPVLDYSCRVWPAIPGTDMAFGADGSLWASSPRGLMHYSEKPDPDNEPTPAYVKLPDALDPASLDSVAPTVDGTVWISTSAGVARFDGTSWKRYTSEQGITEETHWVVASQRDGGVWARGKDGIHRYVKGTDRWQDCTALPATDAMQWARFAPSPDGLLYLFTEDEVYRLNGPNGSGLPQRCATPYAQLAPARARLGQAADGAVALDGSVWLPGRSAEGAILGRLDPATGEVRIFTYRSSGGALALDSIQGIAAATDGGIWVGYGADAVRLLPSTPRRPEQWQVHKLSKESTETSGEFLTGMTPGPAGTILYVTSRSAGRCAVPQIR
jgi:ligand-binding sensor domain-containing protein